jgi:hypothetical protein
MRRVDIPASQESDDLEDVSFAVERDRHPAGVGPPAVLLRGAGADEPVPKGALERQVRAAVAVQVAELAAVEADGDGAEALRARVHARPPTRFGDDLPARGEPYPEGCGVLSHADAPSRFVVLTVDVSGAGNVTSSVPGWVRRPVRLLLAQLGLRYERVPVDIFNGETLTDRYASINAMRTTPVLETVDGHLIPESHDRRRRHLRLCARR